MEGLVPPPDPAGDIPPHRRDRLGYASPMREPERLAREVAETMGATLEEFRVTSLDAPPHGLIQSWAPIGRLFRDTGDALLAEDYGGEYPVSRDQAWANIRERMALGLLGEPER